MMTITPFTSERAADALNLVNLLRTSPLTLPEFCARDGRWPAGDLRLRWLGRVKGRVVAFGQLFKSPYAPADHLAVQIAVDPGYRLRGNGSKMIDWLEYEAKVRGFCGLVATLPEAATYAHNWAHKRGFRRHALHCDAVLDLQSFDTGAAIPAGITLADMIQADAAAWHEVAALMQILIADTPDMHDLPPWALARCLSVLRDAPGSRPDWVIVARANGRLVGLTVGHAMGDEIYSFFTGIVRDWRGRHVGRALKLHLIEVARSHGIAKMRTTNLDTNTPALRLNKGIGFRRVPGSLELRKALA